MENNKVVYLHRKKTDGTIFYVGMGGKYRPNSKKDRSPYWKHTVNKHGYDIEVVATNLTHEDACELEMFLISEIGRKDLGEGTLVNLTDGGEGLSNVNEETLKKIIKGNRKNMKPISQYNKKGELVNTYRSISFAAKETSINVRSISDCAIGKVNTAGGYAWEYADKKYEHHDSRFDRGSEAMMDEKNPMSKMVLNTETGIFYNSISSAFRSQSRLKERAFKAQLSGQNKNHTPFIVV